MSTSEQAKQTDDQHQVSTTKNDQETVTSTNDTNLREEEAAGTDAATPFTGADGDLLGFTGTYESKV